MRRLFSFVVISVMVTIAMPSDAYGQFGKLLDKADKAKDKIMGSSADGLDIGSGLKEALEVGVGEAVDQLSAEGGYLQSVYKIDIPEDAARIIKTVKKVPGFEDVEDKLIQQMNEAAQIAAKKATPIFVGAIKGMSFADAKNILMGEDNAATAYLDATTRTSLYTEFMPVIQSSLDQVNARTYWQSVVTAYNKVPFVKKMNPELDDHVNGKALDGLFGLIMVKEKGIRSDVSQRTSPLLKEVFGKQD